MSGRVVVFAGVTDRQPARLLGVAHGAESVQHELCRRPESVAGLFDGRRVGRLIIRDAEDDTGVPPLFVGAVRHPAFKLGADVRGHWLTVKVGADPDQRR